MSLHYLAKLLLQTCSTFSKSVMVFMGMSKFGKINLIFDDPVVKITGVYYCDVLLIEQLLSVTREISWELFIFCDLVVFWLYVTLIWSFYIFQQRLCSWTLSTGDNQPSRMRDTHFHFIRPDLNPGYYRAEPGGIGPWNGRLTIVLQCYDTVGWVMWPVKPSPKWPIMCRVGR